MPDDGSGFTGNSYDNTGELGADRWRHVAFIEQRGRRSARLVSRSPAELRQGLPTTTVTASAG